MVDCTGLENRQRETVREFESHRLRQLFQLFGSSRLTFNSPQPLIQLLSQTQRRATGLTCSAHGVSPKVMQSCQR